MKKLIFLLLAVSAAWNLHAQPGKEFKTQGITSSAQTTFLNKIVFAPNSSAIAFQKEVTSDFKSDFTFGDEIYLRIYLDNSLCNYLIKELPTADPSNISKNAFFKAHFFLDGKEISTSTINGELQESHKKEWTTFKGAFNNGGSGGNPILRDGYSLFLTECDNLLTNGKHTIRIEIRPCIEQPVAFEGKTVATGEFTLTVLPTSINPYDEDMCLAKAQMSNPTLEARVMKKYASMPENSKQVKEARITMENWDIIRNEYTSVILRRELSLVVVSINKDGKYVYKNCYISQEYVGGKFQDEFSYRDDGYESRISSRCFGK